LVYRRLARGRLLAATGEAWVMIQVWNFTGPDANAARQKAFDRRGEVVDRLNHVSTAYSYSLTAAGAGKEDLTCAVNPGVVKTRFDKLMYDFVTRTDQLIPLRFVDGNDFVDDGSGNKVSICQDNFLSGKVDIDDLGADDDWGFQAVMVHVLTERYAVASYKDNLDDAGYLMPNYLTAHFAARDKEGALYQYLFRDTTITAPHNTLRDRSKPYVTAFVSAKGYAVMEVIDKPSDPVAGLRTWVQKNAMTKVSIDDFIKERALAAAPVPA
jgi:hypothetical protein